MRCSSWTISYMIACVLIVNSLLWVMGSMFMSGKTMMAENEPFECGFEEKDSSRTGYSISFFFYTLVFLVFDAEVVMFIPLIMMDFDLVFIYKVCLLVILLILFLGVLLEWLIGSFIWFV